MVLHTEQDYFDALEHLFERLEYDSRSLLLFTILIKTCHSLERRKRVGFWQHLKWSN